jgi:hypothetical protein
LLISELSNRDRRCLNRTLGHWDRSLLISDVGNRERSFPICTLGQRDRSLLNCTVGHSDRTWLIRTLGHAGRSLPKWERNERDQRLHRTGIQFRGREEKITSLGTCTQAHNIAKHRDRGESHLSSPPTPPDKRVRIRRFDELLPYRTAQRPEVQVAPRRWWFLNLSSSLAGFTRSQLAQAQPED